MQETEEPAKKKTAEQEEEEESEVKRIERELESSADELCQGAAASVSASASGSISASPGVPAVDENDLSSDSQQKSEHTTATTGLERCANSPDDPEASAAGSADSASDDLEDILCDMMIQTSSSHFQHPRQPMQNYGHGMHGSLRQGGYHHHHHHHHHQVSGNFGDCANFRCLIQWRVPWKTDMNF